MLWRQPLRTHTWQDRLSHPLTLVFGCAMYIAVLTGFLFVVPIPLWLVLLLPLVWALPAAFISPFVLDYDRMWRDMAFLPLTLILATFLAIAVVFRGVAT